MLVISAREQNDLFVERVEPRDGTRRARRDGIVVPLHATDRPHRLDAVLDADKGTRSLAHDLVGHQTVERRHGGEVVFDIVHPRQTNVRDLHDRFLASVMAQDDTIPAQERAVRDLFAAAEEPRPRCRLFRELARDVVVFVENSDVALVLIEIDILLRRDVLVHILVHIQMVRRKVRHHRDVRRALHIKQLERRELDDREVFRLHLLRVAQQRVADVAAEIHGLPRRAQHFGDDARRGGLAVAARHADDRTWADLEKDLHFRRHDAAARFRLEQRRNVRPHARRAENDVRAQIIEVAFAKLQVRAQRFKLLRALAEVFAALFVAGDDLHTVSAQKLDERRVAHADAEHCRCFSPQRG